MSPCLSVSSSRLTEKCSIRNSICSLVRQSDVSNLSLVRKSFYQLIRPILFHHPEIDTFNSLVLFSRTISEATYMGKADRNWSNQECLDQTKSLNLIIDPERNNGQPVCHHPSINLMFVQLVSDATTIVVSWSMTFRRSSLLCTFLDFTCFTRPTVSAIL